MVNPVIERIRARLHDTDQNYLAFFCGQTGSGKSESSISLALLIDPAFTVDQIVFTVEQFFALLNSGKLHKGSCIIWEELGTSIDSRTFFSLQNRAVTYTLEAFRALNLALLLNLPGLDMADSRVRKLAHAYFETFSINRRKKTCKCRVYDSQYNPKSGKIYYPHPKAIINGEEVTIDFLEFDKPPDSIIEGQGGYKEKKAAFISTLNLGLERQLQDKKTDSQRGKPKDVEAIFQAVLADKKAHGVYYWPGGDKLLIKSEVLMALFNLGGPTARKAKAIIEHRLNADKDLLSRYRRNHLKSKE